MSETFTLGHLLCLTAGGVLGWLWNNLTWHEHIARREHEDAMKRIEQIGDAGSPSTASQQENGND